MKEKTMVLPNFKETSKKYAKLLVATHQRATWPYLGLEH